LSPAFTGERNRTKPDTPKRQAADREYDAARAAFRTLANQICSTITPKPEIGTKSATLLADAVSSE